LGFGLLPGPLEVGHTAGAGSGSFFRAPIISGWVFSHQIKGNVLIPRSKFQKLEASSLLVPSTVSAWPSTVSAWLSIVSATWVRPQANRFWRAYSDSARCLAEAAWPSTASATWVRPQAFATRSPQFSYTVSH
jgi:hypothetical protein